MQSKRYTPWLSGASFWYPDFLQTTAWADHAPFAFWLVDALRPISVVELGTHTGYSYFAFCQAVRDLLLDSRCYAIDRWTGDEHAGFYDESVFHGVREYAEAHYSAFSSLIRSSFDDALRHFEDGTIDLLHIDGRHFYDDVKHDFESWRPKLSPRAVVLLHDTNVRERDFGVFRLWEEVKEIYPSFEFPHGYGLGVLGVGASPAKNVAAFFAATSDPAAVVEVQRAYARLGVPIQLELTARQNLSESDRRAANAEEQVRRLSAQLVDAEIRSMAVEGQGQRNARLAVAGRRVSHKGLVRRLAEHLWLPNRGGNGP